MQCELSHVRIDVRDLGVAIEFYTSHLGMSVTEQGDTYAFLSNCDRHHVVALYREDSTSASWYGKGRIDHIAFEVRNERELAQAYCSFVDAGVIVDAVDNGISWSLYVEDPDENRLEVFCDRRHRSEGTTTWEMRRDALDAATLLSARDCR